MIRLNFPKAALLVIAMGAATCGFAQGKYKQDTDKMEKMYKLLEVKPTAEKMYSYKECFVMSGDTIKSVKDADADAYMAYIKSIDVFSEDYLNAEKKWFNGIRKDISKNGFSLEKIEDKYYGENPEAVKEELKLRKNVAGYYFARYFGGIKRGGHCVFKSTFTKAGYDMKIAATHIGEDWYIDWIRQGKDRN